jgi:CO/xanthine dehydrogenase Mo-binding subunit
MLDRREFLARMGGGLAVFALAEPAPGQDHDPFPPSLEAWLHIGKDGVVTAYTGKIEAGQGARTELMQAVAEELRTPLASVRLIMADTSLTPYDMGTFGSRTTPAMVPQLRKAAATARELLLDLAAKAWNADRAALVAAEGAVRNPAGGQSSSYGELTRGEKLTAEVRADAPLTPAAEWKIAGRPAAKAGAEDFVTGRQKFASDLKRPGMLYGKVVRPPSFGATLVSYEGAGAVREGDFLGVSAPSPLEAERAAAAVKAEWKETTQPSAAGLFDYLKQHAEPEARPVAERGSVKEALAEAEVKLTQTYTVAYIAHCPPEPRAAVAEWNGDRLTVWTASQRPFGVRSELAQAFGVAEEHIRVIVPDGSAGYGGKHIGDPAMEAARLARAAGKPVKVAWTREEEFTWAYFRPAGIIEVSSGATKAGAITAWDFLNINSGAAGIQIAYDIPNQRIAFQPSKTPLRQGSYRALAATANHFARETHIDELAHACGVEPLAFRLKNTRDPRFKAVLEAAAERFGKAAPGRFLGLAAGWEKGSYVATFVEISIGADGRPKVERVVEAFECGAIVNPDNLRNQIAGAIIMGLGGAQFEAIDFANGRILNGRFSRYRLPRFSDVPLIEVAPIDRKDLPSVGAGETPIVGIAPAIGNALFAATGRRVRSLPLKA